MALTEDKVARYRQQLREQETPEPESLNAQELQDVWRHGNQRRPVPPNYSDNHKVDIVHLERQWIQFCYYGRGDVSQHMRHVAPWVSRMNVDSKAREKGKGN